MHVTVVEEPKTESDNEEGVYPSKDKGLVETSLGVDVGLLIRRASEIEEDGPSILRNVHHDLESPEGFQPMTPSNGPGVFGRRMDVNVYAQRKTLAQGMMDVALLSANANQLRYVYAVGNSSPYYYSSLVLIYLSIILQIAVGVGLICNTLFNIKKDAEMNPANRINNFTMVGIFLITILNVFISAFGVGFQEAATHLFPSSLP